MKLILTSGEAVSGEELADKIDDGAMPPRSSGIRPIVDMPPPEYETVAKSAPLAKAALTSAKAKKILHDKEVKGKPLTDQQRKYMGAVAGGTARKAITSGANVEDEEGGITKETEEKDEVAEEQRKEEATPDKPAKTEGTEKCLKKSMDTPGLDALSDFNSLDYFPREEGLEKAIYIGPRGGRWLDPKHTVPYKPEKTAEGRREKQLGKEADKKVKQGKKEDDKAGITFVHPQYGKVTAKPKAVPEGGKPRYDLIGEHGYVETVSGAHIEAVRSKATKPKPPKGKSLTNIQAHQLLAQIEDKQPVVDNMSPTDQSTVAALEQAGLVQVRPNKQVVPTKEGTASLDKWSAGKLKPEGALGTAADKPRWATPESAKNWKPGDPIPKFQYSHEQSQFEKEHPKAKPKKKKRGKKGGLPASGGAAQGQTPGLQAKKSMDGIESLREFVGESLEKPLPVSGSVQKSEVDTMSGIKALAEFADETLEKCMGRYGYTTGYEKYQDWANRFWEDTKLRVEALRCVKEMIMLEKKEADQRKNAKTWQELEELPRSKRQAYRKMRDQANAEVDKQIEAVKVRMAALDEKAIDNQIKEAEMRASLKKSDGQGGLPAGEPSMGGKGPEQGGKVAGKGKTSGSKAGQAGPGTDSQGQVIAPAVDEEILSEDDEEPESQLTPHKKPIEKLSSKSMANPDAQREMTAQERAQVVSKLRKGEAHVQAGVGIPPPTEPIPEKPAVRFWNQGKGSRVLYSDGADQRVSELLKSQEGFYMGQSPTVTLRSAIINGQVKCLRCERNMSKSLSACPHCGAGTVKHRPTPNGPLTGRVGNDIIIKSRGHGPGLRRPVERVVKIVSADK